MRDVFLDYQHTIPQISLIRGKRQCKTLTCKHIIHSLALISYFLSLINTPAEPLLDARFNVDFPKTKPPKNYKIFFTYFSV